MKIIYKAPAKVILSGEHSVVYTKPAFVTALDLHLSVTIEKGQPSSIDPVIQQAVKSCDAIVQQYLKKHLKGIQFSEFSYSYSSTIPQGRGMGSSAAFCVATVAALLDFYTGHEHEKQTINSLAYECEKYFHGMPSGVDVSASCYGGLIFYRKEFEFLKTISALNFKMPKTIQERLFLIDSGKPVETTKDMVSHVGKRYNANPKHMEHVLSEIEKVTKRMVVSIVKEDSEMFAESIKNNQKLLEDVGIVSEKAKKLLKELEPLGVGKVTGAGGTSDGSGFIIFFCNRDKEQDLLKKIPAVIRLKQDYNGVTKISD